MPTQSALLPLRPNAGIALFNEKGLVFAGRSLGAGPETVTPGHEWQLPQGGIDPGEDLVAAARRELMEETSVTSADFLAATDTWWPYEWPAYSGPWHPLCAYRGQTQKWVAFRFTGSEEEIDVVDPIGGVRPEFFAWDWVPLSDLPRLVMPHKRENYERVVQAFSHFAG